MEPEGSLPHSQVPVTCPCPKPARSSPYPTTHFLKIHLNIILPSTAGSPKWSLSLRFPRLNPVYAFPLPRTSYMPRPSYSSQFYHRTMYIYIYVYILYTCIHTYPFPLDFGDFQTVGWCYILAFDILSNCVNSWNYRGNCEYVFVFIATCNKYWFCCLFCYPLPRFVDCVPGEWTPLCCRDQFAGHCSAEFS